MAEKIFRNWAGTVECRPARWEFPRNELELRAILRRGEPGLRPVGAGHSWSPLVHTSGTLVSLAHYEREGGPVLEARKGILRVSAGWTLARIVQWAAARGWALSSLGSIQDQAIGGAIATGTHGSGARYGNLSSRVVGLRLLTPQGEALELSPEREPALFRAAKLSLGLLGFVTEVSLQCEPLFDLHELRTLMPWDEAVGAMNELVQTADHVKLWWLPHTEQVMVCAATRSTELRTLRSRLGRWLEEGPVLDRAFRAVLSAGKHFPEAIPALNRLVAGVYFTPRSRVDRSDRVFRVPIIPQHRETEFAVPAGRGPEALRALHTEVTHAGLKLNFVQEARYVAGDDAWLSPAAEGGRWQLGAYMPEGRDREAFFALVERCLLAHEGRPHWGKEFRADAHTLAGRWSGWERFLAIRAALDPAGRMLNGFLRRVLGL